MQDAATIFRQRWRGLMMLEVANFRDALPELIGSLAGAIGPAAHWIALHLTQAIRAIETILPDEDFTAAHLEIATLTTHPASAPNPREFHLSIA